MKVSLSVVVSVLIVATVVACSSSHQSMSLPTPPSPRLPIKTFHYVGFSVPRFPPNPDNLVAAERATGVEATTVSLYMSLGKKLDISAVTSLCSSEILPIIEIDSDRISFRDIVSGAKDVVFKSYAKLLGSVHCTVAVDFDHEFNARWTEWGYTHETAAVFVSAWRHIVTIFRNNGATNVDWIWNPHVFVKSTTPIRPWYPGTSWVTMIGLDGYFYTSKDTFKTVFGSTLKQVHAFTRLPIFIIETGVNPTVNRSAQIHNLFNGAREAGIVGVIWFDYHKYPGHNWIINNDPAALTAFREAAKKYR